MQDNGISIGIGDSGEMADGGLPTVKDNLNIFGAQLVYGRLHVLDGYRHGAAVLIAQFSPVAAIHLIERESFRANLKFDPAFSVPGVELQAQRSLVEFGAALDVANVVSMEIDSEWFHDGTPSAHSIAANAAGPNEASFSRFRTAKTIELRKTRNSPAIPDLIIRAEPIVDAPAK